MTAGPAPADAQRRPSAERGADLLLARVHLRLGSLALARAELETAAGRDGLDDDAILDLAEARWRTGDLVGAGEAATTYLETHPDDVLGLVIAAEAQAGLGRPVEASRLANRALERAPSIDAVFAGMPRSDIWPADPGVYAEPVGTLFAESGSSGPIVGSDDASAADEVGSPTRITPDGPGLWDDQHPPGPPADTASLLDAARAALATGRIGDATLSLGLALRAEPQVAPAVLDLLAGRTEPELAVVRGDAYRAGGHEAEARRAYAFAAAGLATLADTTTPSSDPAPDPVADHPDQVADVPKEEP